MGGDIANDITVAERCCDRTIQNELHRRGAAGQNGVFIKKHDACAHFRGRMMQADGKPLAYGLLLAAQQTQPRIDAIGRRVKRRIERHIAAMDGVLGNAVTHEIERAAFAGAAFVRDAVLRMQAAHACGQA